MENFEIELKRQEFYHRVDAGEFDQIIFARDTHKEDQADEWARRMERPTTPDELIESAEYAANDRWFDEFMANPDMRKSLDKANKKDMEEGNILPLEEIQKLPVEKRKITVLRFYFKEEAFQEFLDGKLEK